MVGRIRGEKFIIVGIPTDIGASLGRPGARYAPRAIREALKWFLNRVRDNKVLDVEGQRVVDLSGRSVSDLGDVEVFSHDVLKTFDTIAETIGKLLGEGCKLIILGGDHSITFPSVRALRRTLRGSLGIVQFDAHLDLLDESPYQGRFSHSSEIRRILELEGVTKVIQVGVRGYNYPFHYEDIKRFGIKSITPAEVRELGPRRIARTLIDELSETDNLYVTVDIDVIDPAFAPGCGANEPGGLAPWELFEMIKVLAPFTIALDIVEVNPPFDFNNITVTIAAKLVFDFIVYSTEPEK